MSLSLKRVVCCFFLFCFVFSACSGPEKMQQSSSISSSELEAEDLELGEKISCKNQTGITLQVLKISVSGTEEWSRDLLQNGSLPPESAVLLDFIPEEGQYYDLLAQDRAGNQIWFCSVPLFQGQMVTLSKL